MKVKVIGCSGELYWYRDKIGKVFEVESCNIDGIWRHRVANNSTGMYFNSEDVELVKEEENKVSKFTKDMLKTGMRVVLRNQMEYQVFLNCDTNYKYTSENCLVCIYKNNTSWLGLDYTDDLRHGDSEYDIMEVKKAGHPYDFVWQWEGYKTIWKREELTEEQKEILELEKVIQSCKDQIEEASLRVKNLKEMKK